MSEIHWDKIPEKKRDAMTKKLTSLARKMLKIDYSKPAHTKMIAKIKFYVVRMLQTGLGKDNQEYTDKTLYRKIMPPFPYFLIWLKNTFSAAVKK